MSEQSIQRTLIEALRLSYGQRIFVRKVPVGPMKVRWGNVPNPLAGMPDILICLQGRFIGIELKTEEAGRYTRIKDKRQPEVHREIRAAGGIVIEASTVEDALAQLAALAANPLR